MNGPTMKEPYGVAPARIPETHFSRCSTRCNTDAGIHYALVETTVEYPHVWLIGFLVHP